MYWDFDKLLGKNKGDGDGNESDLFHRESLQSESVHSNPDYTEPPIRCSQHRC